ncbi:unnamed protein product [Colias eurytheme]|nr:unnamed protein product [Colias eurytheme]
MEKKILDVFLRGKLYFLGKNLLQEPSTLPCRDNISVLVIVASSPFHVNQREAIRITWATRLRTLFIIGLNNAKEIDHLSDRHKGDLVVYQFQEHYQNLTLKTALMLKWTAQKCSSKINFLLKTDDDILINPWQIERIVKENLDADLIGYKNENAAVYHNEDEKWFLPHWLYADDMVPEYLSGNAYLINGKHVLPILKAAYSVPVINIEDIYFTFLVAKKKLGLRLTHEPRLRGFKPWLPLTQFYWNLASVHSLSPTEMLKWWSKLVTMGEK